MRCLSGDGTIWLAEVARLRVRDFAIQACARGCTLAVPTGCGRDRQSCADKRDVMVWGLVLGRAPGAWATEVGAPEEHARVGSDLRVLACGHRVTLLRPGCRLTWLVPDSEASVREDLDGELGRERRAGWPGPARGRGHGALRQPCHLVVHSRHRIAISAHRDVDGEKLRRFATVSVARREVGEVLGEPCGAVLLEADDI